jgi:glycerol uptake facilitator-like aquaporin
MPFTEGGHTIGGLTDSSLTGIGHLGLPGLSPDVSIIDAVIMEVLMTIFLVLVIFGPVVEPRSPEANAPRAIGSPSPGTS